MGLEQLGGEGKFYTVFSETQISQSEVKVAHHIGKKRLMERTSSWPFWDLFKAWNP